MNDDPKLTITVDLNCSYCKTLCKLINMHRDANHKIYSKKFGIESMEDLLKAITMHSIYIQSQRQNDIEKEKLK